MPSVFVPCDRDPASGLRRADTNGGVQPGELDNVGDWGFSWSASPNAAGSGNAGNLNFNSNGNVYPFNNNHRGHGFPVRCARAFTLLEREIFQQTFRVRRVVAARREATPASGLRRANTEGSVPAGELDVVGIWGYSWSASPNAAGSGNAGYLEFNSNGNVRPLNGNYRGFGFPVRCARAFTLLEKKKLFERNNLIKQY